MKIAVVAFVLCFVVLVNTETPVEQCQQGRPEGGYKQSITVGRCRKPPCRLKKKTVVNAEFKFTPDRDVEKITNTVNALIVGLPFPFIGVDETEACSQIYQSDGTTKAGCPLKAGQEYVYKNQIEVREIYPRLKLVVHWGLTGNDGRDVMCFQVPAKITN